MFTVPWKKMELFDIGVMVKCKCRAKICSPRIVWVFSIEVVF